MARTCQPHRAKLVWVFSGAYDPKRVPDERLLGTSGPVMEVIAKERLPRHVLGERRPVWSV